MLFDLRSRHRRRAVKVIYVFLALVMIGGLLLVGVGTGSSGGLLNGFTNNGSSGSSGVDMAPVNSALKATRENPKSAAAWASLISARWTAANEGGNYDSNTLTYSASGLKQLRQLAADWQQYQALASKPSTLTATLAARALEHTSQFVGAAAAWELIAASEQTAGAYFCLAANSYAAKQTRKGDLAAAQAVSLTPKLQRLTVKQQLTTAKTSSSYAQAC
jgi:hypothetical protein